MKKLLRDSNLNLSDLNTDLLINAIGMAAEGGCDDKPLVAGFGRIGCCVLFVGNDREDVDIVLICSFKAVSIGKTAFSCWKLLQNSVGILESAWQSAGLVLVL